MSDAQVAFAVTHYDGTQKMTRDQADRLRAADPDFLILHYRLGHGLGYRAIDPPCQPTGGVAARRSRGMTGCRSGPATPA